MDQRKAYVEHDNETKERIKIADKFNERFLQHGVQAQVAGETGLDITRWCNKRTNTKRFYAIL